MVATSTVPTQIRIDSKIKEQASALFADLGLDMSGAVNIFLRQCILRGGLPFNVEIPHFSEEVLEAISEARAISRDPDVKGYDNLKDLKAALEE